ncbi:MAG: hypothetical protein ABIH63_00300 [archaeon]
MVVVFLEEWKLERQVRDRERRLERLVKDYASVYYLCKVSELLKCRNQLEDINPANPYIHLADGVLCAKAAEPYSSYAQSVKHFNLFLRSFPYDEDAVWWRLDSATNLASEKHNTYFLSKIARDAVKSFPHSIPILNAAYVAYHNGVQDMREAMKVGVRILELDPYDDQIRKNVNTFIRMLRDDEKFYSGLISSRRGVRFDHKKC